MIRLERRDLEILSALEVWGVLGLGHVQGAFFLPRQAGPKAATDLLFDQAVRQKGCAYRRLKKLEADGHLAVHRVFGHPQVYGLSEKGYGTLKRRGLSRLPSFYKRVSPFTLNHMLITASVGLFLERIFRLSIKTARQIYSVQLGFKRARESWKCAPVPDIAMLLSGGWVPVEVELHQKSDQRYRELWKKYGSRLPPGAPVLYLVPSGERAQGLLELADSGYHPQVHVQTLPAFRESLGQISFQNHRGRFISIRELAHKEEAAAAG